MDARLHSFISIMGETNDGSTDKFLVTLVKDGLVWRGGEPNNTSKVFITKHGVYIYAASPDAATLLKSSDGKRTVARLVGLNPNTVAIGDEGRFQAEETARIGEWQVI